MIQDMVAKLSGLFDPPSHPGLQVVAPSQAPALYALQGFSTIPQLEVGHQLEFAVPL